MNPILVSILLRTILNMLVQSWEPWEQRREKKPTNVVLSFRNFAFNNNQHWVSYLEINFRIQVLLLSNKDIKSVKAIIIILKEDDILISSLQWPLKILQTLLKWDYWEKHKYWRKTCISHSRIISSSKVCIYIRHSCDIVNVNGLSTSEQVK